VVGDKEVENNAVSIRHRADGDLGQKPFGEFVEMILPELKP